MTLAEVDAALARIRGSAVALIALAESEAVELTREAEAFGSDAAVVEIPDERGQAIRLGGLVTGARAAMLAIAHREIAYALGTAERHLGPPNELRHARYVRGAAVEARDWLGAMGRAIERGRSPADVVAAAWRRVRDAQATTPAGARQ